MNESGIFKDLIVVELASVLAGPAVGMFLAELGARVLKIEHFKYGGDVTRSWKLPTENPKTDIPAYFSSVNWGKESVGIDLKSELGKELVYELVKEADIVVASYKPGDAKKLRMDAETLRAINPRLIYADLTAYGPEDPRTGFDAIIQAEAGFSYMNGSSGGPPVKMPVALMDLLAGHQLKEGILLALYHRERSGEGTYLSTSLLGAAVASLANQAANWLVGGHIPQRIGSDHPNIVPYGTVFYTSDGKPLVLAVGNDGQFQRLCACLAIEEVAKDDHFRGNADRVRQRDSLLEILANAISAWERKPLLESLWEAKVPVGAVLNMEEVFEQPAAQIQVMEKGDMKGVKTVAIRSEAGFSREELNPPPSLCLNTEQVLKEVLGFEQEKIAKLLEANVIGIYGSGTT